jgi:NAD(P)-dependent dehydrogenase (short-subunit alcohol dehydrogenase family)
VNTLVQVVVVIGAGGIGQAIARLQGSGKTVLLADLNQEALASAAKALEASGHNVTTRPVDVSSPHRVPGLGVTHELDVGSHLVPRARGQDGERDAPGVEVDGVLHVPGRGGAALALPLVRRAVVPHVLVDHELVATLEQGRGTGPARQRR